MKVSANGELIFSSSETIPSINRIKIVPTSELPPPPPDGRQPRTQEIPTEFALEQNYPNPLNPLTVIRYSLPVGGLVTLKVYNVFGQEIATLVDEMQDAGYKSVNWDATNAPSAVYFYKISAGQFSDVKKMLLIK